jgi:hypothetical protein
MDETDDYSCCLLLSAQLFLLSGCTEQPVEVWDIDHLEARMNFVSMFQTSHAPFKVNTFSITGKDHESHCIWLSQTQKRTSLVPGILRWPKDCLVTSSQGLCVSMEANSGYISPAFIACECCLMPS